MAQATGAETAYPSLDDLSGALAYFERPDENQILRALFERGAAAPIRTVAAPVIADPPDIGADEFERTVQDAHAPAADRRRRRDRRLRLGRLARGIRWRLRTSGDAYDTHRQRCVAPCPHGIPGETETEVTDGIAAPTASHGTAGTAASRPLLESATTQKQPAARVKPIATERTGDARNSSNGFAQILSGLPQCCR